MTSGGRRPGAGRPRIYPDGAVTITYYLDPKADQVVREHAARTGMTLSRAASAIILDWQGRSSPLPTP